jgi:PAS domain S-box-containing protein
MIRIAGANRYVAVTGAVFLAGALLATISLTTFDPRWVVFLGGVLAAAILAGVSRTVNARWTIARRTSQLNATRARLATEVRLRAHAEEALARERTNVSLIDEALPAMLVYFDAEERVRYHNHAFSRLIGRERGAIDGAQVVDIVGRDAYAGIGPHVKAALQGRDVRYERSQAMPHGESCRLYVQYLPRYDGDGRVAGVFAILTEITRAAGLANEPEPKGDDVGERLILALENDEFLLHSQAIVPLGHAPRGATFREVLLRMKEEEDKHLPPGMFLPLAEELGMLHEIDRWVVRHVLEFAAKAGHKADAAYFVNLSGPTILDKGFAPFVRAHLKASRAPDNTLCFELPEADLLANPAAYREFVTALDGTGCRFAVTGFGRNLLSIRLLKQLRVDFLKIDAGIVIGTLSSPTALARVKAINDAAHAAGMRTVAECVESEPIRAALARVGTDFAQGFGISKPGPMRLAEDPADPNKTLEPRRAAA